MCDIDITISGDKNDSNIILESPYSNIVEKINNNSEDLYNQDNYNYKENEYDYIIVGTGAGGAGVLLKLLSNESKKFKILVLEQGGDKGFSYDKNINNGFGSFKFNIDSTEIALNNNNIFSVDTAPEDITEYNNNIKKDQIYPILVANVLGGNTTNNAGIWHHQPITNMASFPPNNLENFNIEKWESNCELVTKHLTGFNREDFFNNSLNSETSSLGIRRLKNMFNNFKNLLKTKWANGLEKFLEYFFTYYNGIPFSDSNFERNEAKLIISTFFKNNEKMGVVPPIFRIFNDYKIIKQNDNEYKNENVTLKLYSQTKKILLDNENNFKAYGVELENNIQYLARYKIFICCGAFDTPKLLAKSNLGKSDWYNNTPKLDSELRNRIDNGMGKLWQTPDTLRSDFLLKDYNNVYQNVQGDFANVNVQTNLFGSTDINKPINLNTFPFLWYITYEYVRYGTISGLPNPLTNKDIKDGYKEYFNLLDITKSLAFFQAIQPYMISKNYSSEDIEKVKNGISNFDNLKLSYSVVNILCQYRVYDNLNEYSGGSINFEKDNFTYSGLKANFGWEQLQKNKSFKETIINSQKYIKENLLTALDEQGLLFKDMDDIINHAISSNNYSNLYTVIFGAFSSKISQDNLNIFVFDPYKWTDINGKEHSAYINPTNLDSNLNNVNATLSSGWHYTGTCCYISNRTTGEVVPGLMIADGSAFQGPVKNNSMASISAIGAYMAEMALDEHKK